MSRWVESGADPYLSCPDECCTVGAERLDGCSADAGSADDAGTIRAPPKVVLPIVSTWVEQTNDVPGARIFGYRDCVLITIAPEAAVAEVVQAVSAATCARD